MCTVYSNVIINKYCPYKPSRVPILCGFFLILLVYIGIRIRPFYPYYTDYFYIRRNLLYIKIGNIGCNAGNNIFLNKQYIWEKNFLFFYYYIVMYKKWQFWSDDNFHGYKFKFSTILCPFSISIIFGKWHPTIIKIYFVYNTI